MGLSWDWTGINDPMTRRIYEEEHERDQAQMKAQGASAASVLVSTDQILSRAHALAELMAYEGIGVLDSTAAEQVWEAAERWSRHESPHGRTLLANAGAALTRQDVLDHIGLALTDT